LLLLLVVAVELPEPAADEAAATLELATEIAAAVECEKGAEILDWLGFRLFQIKVKTTTPPIIANITITKKVKKTVES